LGEMFLSEMLLSAIAAKEGMEVAEEGLGIGEYEPKTTMVIRTVKGDLHDIGKNLVGRVLEGRSFILVDLGVEVNQEEFVTAIKDHRPEF